jgi:multidrug efflux pump subunit AcrB
MKNGNISAWAIRNPLPSILLFVVLTVTGLYSFSRLPVTYFPTIITPAVQVTVEQSGATPVELETEVTRLIENAIASLPGIDELASTIGEGRSVTTVEFKLGFVSPDRAMDDVRDAIARIRGDLPGTIDEPVVERIEEDAQSVVTYAVSSRDMTVAELSWFVDDVVSRDLQGLAGVGRIERVGGADREVHVELDADRLQALSLSVSAINETIMQTQIDRSGGRSDMEGGEQVLTTAAAARTVEELGEQRISLSGENSVRLNDVASVRDTIAEPRAFATLDGADIVGFAVYRSEGASDVAVATVVAAAVRKLSDSRPDLHFRLIDDNVSYTAGNYHSAMHTLLEGAALSIVVVFLFLRDWRATLVAAVALPLSIIPTFFAIDLLGFSLNILSLLAITLVTGILVDDAIVEIENVVRHRSMGKSAYRAALDASEEIGLAVIAISATIIAVFAPVGLMSGVVGLYFREFGLTVAIAVFFSLLVARLITPIMAAYVMTGSLVAAERKGRLSSVYESLLRLSLRWKWVTVGSAFALFAAAMIALISVPTTFLPEEDTGRLMLTVELPPGATLGETRRVTDGIAAEIRKLTEVEGVLVRAGASMGGQQDVRYAVVSIDLVHKSMRGRSSFAIEGEIEGMLAPIPDVRLRFLNNRGGRDVSFAVLGSDGQAVQKAADAILRDMAADGSFVGPASDNVAMRPELRMTVLADKAATLGVSAAAIASTMRISTIGDVDSRLANFIEGSRQIPVRVVLDRAARARLSVFETLNVPAVDGTKVPLSAVAEIGFNETVAAIDRFDRQRRVEIGADMANGLTSGQGLERLLQLDSVKNLTSGVRVQATGDSDTEGDVFESFAVAMGGGIMLVLIVLILLFKSVLSPLTILASLPLSIGGVAAALLLSGNSISLPVVIGILMLMGIVTKNAIMLVDFAVEREAHGLSRMEAVVDACSERIRPIIMTTLAMAGGMLPSAFGVGDGGEFRAPMAISVIGGLLVSTVLSLIVIPSLHLIMSSFSDRLSRVFRPFLQSADAAHSDAEDGAPKPHGA